MGELGAIKHAVGIVLSSDDFGCLCTGDLVPDVLQTT